MNATVPLDELYDNLDQQGIEVFHCSTKEVVAVAEPSGYLCIDPQKVESTEHEREILIHEEGHFATNTFYQLDSPYTVREHQENIAVHYGFKKYYSVEKLLSLMEEGYTEVWQLAEQLSVREEYVQEMLDYYTQACNVNFVQELAERKRAREIEDDPITPETLQKLQGIAFSCDGPLTETSAQDILRFVEMVRGRKSREK